MKKTFENQGSLPILPIPELSKTCNEFIEWVQPLLSKEEFNRTKNIVEKFKCKDGDGEKLQRELIKWSERNELTNWTAPLWEDIYLKSRRPLIIEGNVFYLMKNKLKSLDLDQAEIATILILSILKFKRLIDIEGLEVDLQSGNPLCMEQYKNLFSTSRIPKKNKDEIQKKTNQKHIIVLYKGHIFSLNVFESPEKVKTYSQIKDELEHICSTSQSAQGQGLGILTSMDRDKWASTREGLLKTNNINREHIEKIETAIFALCLEEESPDSLEDISKLMLRGNGGNRWFDKSLQFIIPKNGEIGINMEHTGVDGSVMSRFIKFLYDDMNILNNSKKEKLKEKPERLDFTINDEIKKTISEATEELSNIILNQETRVLVFDEFGTNQIKTFKISPDAFVQLALQLAQFKLFGSCNSAYEAVMTRKFLHGRIEVMHTISQESMELIKNITSSSCDDNVKRTSLRQAAKKHIERIKACQDGNGVDGHMMALLKIHEDFGGKIGIKETPEIFTDKGYKVLTHSTICTSTTSSYGLELAGWGPVVEDGFGVRYINDKDAIRFNMTSRKYFKKDLEKLTRYVEESLIEMAELMKN